MEIYKKNFDEILSDINECTDPDSCDVGYKCINTVGSFECEPIITRPKYVRSSSSHSHHSILQRKAILMDFFSPAFHPSPDLHPCENAPRVQIHKTEKEKEGKEKMKRKLFIAEQKGMINFSFFRLAFATSWREGWGNIFHLGHFSFFSLYNPKHSTFLTVLRI